MPQSLCLMASVRSKETMIAAERIGDEGERFTFRAPSAAASHRLSVLLSLSQIQKASSLVFSIQNGIPSKNQNRF